MKKKKKEFCIVISIIVIISIIEFFLAGLLKNQSIFLEAVYYISQFVNCIAVLFGVVYAAWQYYLSVADSRRQTNIIRVQKAIDLAQYYKDNILKYYPPIRYILENSGIEIILKKIPADSMRNFDCKELQQYITDSDKKKLQELQISDNFIKAVIEANSIYHMHFELNPRITSLEEKDNNKQVTITIEKDPVITAFMSNYITETLNNLEFFAMHFTHNSADSSVIYQSIHQSYIEIAEYLYYFIAEMNTDSVDKLFTNLIELYRRWKIEKTEKEEQRVIQDSSLQTHGTIVD